MIRPTLAVIAALALCVPIHGAQSPSSTAWGATTRGLQVGVTLSTGGSVGEGVAFDVSFKNAGASDFVLNLGYMLANGKVMFPNAVRVALTRPSGTTCELEYLDRRYPGVAGRIDDFVVALPAGAMYTLRVLSDRLWCPATKEFQLALGPGRYQVTARFEGRGAAAQNPDMAGVALLNFWKGTAASAEASFDVER